MATNKLPAIGFFDKHRDKIAFAGPDDCWLWNAGRSSRGYGKVSVCGWDRRAHREAFEAIHGPGSAAGLVVRHSCDTPPCVNPAHLLVGTQGDNVRDKVERDRQAKGETNGRAKLTEADVATIRAEYVRGCRTRGNIAMARRFGVSDMLISKIMRRVLWAHMA